MAGLVSVEGLFHPKAQEEEQDGSLQVTNLVGARILNSIDITIWSLLKEGVNKSDVSFRPISLSFEPVNESWKREDHFISGDQKQSLTSSQTKFGIMWVTQFKLVM